MRLKFPQRQKSNRCYRTERLKLGPCSCEFEHITCVITRREPNNSVNFVCMAID